jgi:hypothetical protein
MEPSRMMRRRTAATRFGSAAGALLLAACSNVLGIHDITAPEDAGADGTESHPDSGAPHDATGADALADSGRGDAVADAEVDGGDAGTCVVVTTTPPPTTGGGACPSDTGGCYPHDMSSWSPSWRPPFGARQGACTDQQITGYYDACRGPNQTQALCTAFGQNLQNATCLACMETPVYAAHYGVVVLDMLTNWVNVAGCIALAEPCNTACAQAINAVAQCWTAACEPYCQQVPYAELQQCEQTSANACPTCEGFFVDAPCITQLMAAGHPAATLCGLTQPGGSLAEFSAIAKTICGT